MNTKEDKYWSPSMKRDHEKQIADHEKAWGAPLGELRRQPTPQEYERGRAALALRRKKQAKAAKAQATESMPAQREGD